MELYNNGSISANSVSAAFDKFTTVFPNYMRTVKDSTIDDISVKYTPGNFPKSVPSHWHHPVCCVVAAQTFSSTSAFWSVALNIYYRLRSLILQPTYLYIGNPAEELGRTTPYAPLAFLVSSCYGLADCTGCTLSTGG
jgi:hypothetical protein